MMEQMEKDRFKELFAELPDEQLPAGFQEAMMERVRKEALRVERRRERWRFLGLFSLIACLLVLICGLFSYLDISVYWPQMRFSLSEYDSFFFYLYIGALAFLLWMVDAFFRKTQHENIHDKAGEKL